jgi:hypothetical protein
MPDKTPDVITVAELDAMSDEDFIALFPAGPSVAGLIVALSQQADMAVAS